MMADDNENKFFDRKFVADNLRSQLCCPKCTREYSLNHTIGVSDADNHRPFLLPCGHHICESCIFKHCWERDFNCAICAQSALPTLIVRDPNGIHEGNIRDYYELSYHVLGEIKSLQFENQYMMNAQDDVLNCCLLNNEIVLETKCSECGHTAATGECKQCTVFYCQRCFEKVHQHSRVLKTHVFQLLDEKQHSGVGRRIGNEIFRMPAQLLCNMHNVPATVFCNTCRRNTCETCVIRHHANHFTCSVTEMNNRYVVEIPSSICSIDAAILQIKNCQMVVKNTKNKLSDFATDTLINISKRFRWLHGQLQIAEQEAIEMMRESSLPPQLQLNGAIKQLKGYETLLKDLRQLLNRGNDDRCEPPKDMWLRDIIVTINEHLEKMPTQVEITRIDRNPYQLETTNNLSEKISGYLKCQYRPPKIEVRFNNEYGILSVISNPNESGQANSTAAIGSTQGGLNKKKKTSESSSSSMSCGESDYQQLNLLRTFSAMDISKANSSESDTVTSQLGDWFRTDAVVHVRSIQSPEDFYVQCVQAAQRMRESLEEFVETSDCRPPNQIVVGQQYITLHKQAEVDRWHRALVIRKADSREIYNVLLPDIGISRKVHSSNFRQLPKNLAKLPYAAVHCSLQQLMPRNGGNVWEPQAIDFMKQVVQNTPVHINFIKTLASQLYEVDLITSNYNSSISVREAFLYTGLARERNIANPLMSQLHKLIALESQRLPKYVPRVGDVLMVQILHVEQPQKFYVMPHEAEHNRSTLLRELQYYMDHISLSKLEPIYLGRVELGCVVQLEGQWYRGCIERILLKGYVLVRLVDMGISKKLYWDQLFMLPRIFWAQESAIECCLADVETLQVNGYTWTVAAIDAFKQLASNPKLQMEVVSVRNKVANVALHFGKNNVAAILVSQGHCESSGVSSKIVKPQPKQLSQLDADTRKLIDDAKEEPEAALPSPEQAHNMSRSPIEVLHVQDPGEFYVTLTHFVSAIAELRKTVQISAEEMYLNSSLTENWGLGDMCYVRVMAQGDQELLWHRGQIVDHSIDPNTTTKYDVRLRDIGELVRGVPCNCLTIMDEALISISNSAMCCCLYNVVPNGNEWSDQAKAFFKTQLEAYSSLYVTGYGRTGDRLNVILWGAKTEISGPFSPTRIKYTNINEMLLQAGHATRDMQLSPKKAVKWTSSSSNSSTNSSFSSSQETDDIELFAGLDIVNRVKASKKTKLKPYLLEHNSEMPPLEFLNDLNIMNNTTGCNEPPVAWLKPRECNKSLFTALPTYVNHQCEIYLTLSNDASFIRYMRNVLVNQFKPMMEEQRQPSSYVVGQPVVVTYHLDNLIYRGIVKSKLNAKGEHKVYYVDYGNEEKVSPIEMLPFAPFPQLNAMCWRTAIHGVQPKQKNYTINTMDAVHQSVVMKLCSVRIVEPTGVNGIPQSQIKVGDMDIATMMLNNEMAIRSGTQEKEDVKHQRAKTLKTFRMFDELHQLGNVQSSQVLDHFDTTVQPPPAKKKLMMDSKEALQTECEKDFDCKEAAKQDELERSVNIEEEGSEQNDSEENNSHEGFSDDYVIEEIVEVHPKQDDEKTSNLEPDQASFMPPQNISAMDQLRRRIQLRYKQERLDTAHFSPMDTSTEHSYFDGVGCFKRQCLPTGVKHFSCSIDKVVTATELQISPQLTEFAKQEIVLAQETSDLIRDAAQLDPVEVKSLCLARYSPDGEWYRAVIKEVLHASKQATVYYMDFHDTEIVPFKHLKAMPKQLFMFPQRSFRVNLYGIKINRSFAETSVRQALQACLCKYPTVYARVHYPQENSDDRTDFGESEHSSSSDSMKQSYKLLEVEIYENKFKTELLYKPLIDSRMFLIK